MNAMLMLFSIHILLKVIYLIKDQVPLNYFPHSPYQIMAFPPIKVGKHITITLYSR